MRILFVDDEFENVETARAHLVRTGLSEDLPAVNFGDAKDAFGRLSPDIVVLDLIDGGNTADPKPTGNTTLEFVWETRFCPIIIYSAHPEAFAAGEWQEHPFVRLVPKGMDSEKAVEAVVKEYKVHVQTLKASEEEVRAIYAAVLRDVAPYAFKEIKEMEPQRDIVKRLGRRRLAARMDDVQLMQGIESWEMYICPPISSRPKTGDILLISGAPPADPASFRMVLTPSCDMARDGQPRQERALLCSCIGCTEALSAANVSMRQESIVKLLTAGHQNGILPLPALAGRIPHMMADLKRFEVVNVRDIGAEGTQLLRVASIDSPFRELVSWAYQSTACRPGLPDRNFASWATALVTP